MISLFRLDNQPMMTHLIQRIQTECSDFLSQCGGFPLIKTLRESGSNFKKVKVRTKVAKTDFVEAFNEAFEDEYKNIHGRSIFCNGKHSKVTEYRFEKIYVLPTNGFKYLYNPNITFHEEYKKIYDKLNSSMNEKDADSLFVDMIEYSYQADIIPFQSALFSQKEIIIYGIPYYYAVKVEKFPDYEDLLNLIKNYG